MNGVGSIWMLAFEFRLTQGDHLMSQSLKVNNHASHPCSRCHVEVVALSAEAGVTVPMNVRPERIRVEELTQRTAPDLNVANTGIQNAQCRTV